MTDSQPTNSPIPKLPKLLVSVRSADEASIALESGADIIDLKEPNYGSLGPVTLELADKISREMGQKIPLSIAMGELSQSGASNGSTTFSAATTAGKFSAGLPTQKSAWPELATAPTGNHVGWNGRGNCRFPPDRC